MKFTVIGIDSVDTPVFEVLDASDYEEAVDEFRSIYTNKSVIIAVMEGDHENLYDPDEDEIEDEEEEDDEDEQDDDDSYDDDDE